MLSNDLVGYLRKERKLDVDFETVETALRKNGWEEEQINEARLWYSQHDVNDITEERSIKGKKELPDLQGTQEEETKINNKTTQHSIPPQTIVKEKKHLFEIKENDNKDLKETSDNKIKISDDEHKEKASELFKILIKSIFTISFVALLAIVSLSFLVTYDIIEYKQTKLTDEAKAFILGLPFTPKTADYVLNSVNNTLYNKPMDMTIKVTSINPNKTLDLNFDIVGKVFLTNNKESYANLTISQKENEIKQIEYVNKKLYTKSQRYNMLIANFLNKFLKFPDRLAYYKWIDNDEYNIPYTEVLNYVYQIGAESKYFNKNAHTIRIRLNDKQLAELSTKLEEIDYSQLTKDLDSMTLTLILSDKDTNIRGLEIEATDKNEIKYIVNIDFKDSPEFTVEEPTPEEQRL